MPKLLFYVNQVGEFESNWESIL